MSGYGPLIYVSLLCDCLAKIIMKQSCAQAKATITIPGGHPTNMGMIWFLAMLIIIFFLHSLFSEQIRWINKALGRVLLWEFSECPQIRLTKDSFCNFYTCFAYATDLKHACHCLQTTNSVFPDLIRMKQTWLELNTEIMTIVSDPNLPLTSRRGKMVLFQNKPASLTIIQNAHLM